MELLKQEKEQLFRTEENLTKDQQLQFLQQTMQGMQQVLGPDSFSWVGKGRVYVSEVKGQPLTRTGKGDEGKKHVEETHARGRKQKTRRWKGMERRVGLVAHGQKNAERDAGVLELLNEELGNRFCKSAVSQSVFEMDDDVNCVVPASHGLCLGCSRGL